MRYGASIGLWVKVSCADSIGEVVFPADLIKFENMAFAGCSAAWLARFVRDEEVVGSNPATPKSPLLIRHFHEISC